MKLSEIKDITIDRIKVKLSDKLYNNSSLTEEYSNLSRDVWLVGPMMGDWFVKINREDLRVHPLFRDHIPWDELKDLEVLSIVDEIISN